MPMVQRIKDIIRQKAKNREMFAEKVGVSINTLDAYLKKKCKISLDLITKILLTYPDLSAEWLLRGEGEMLRTSIYNNVNNFEINKNSTVHKGDVTGSYNSVAPSDSELQQEVKTLKEKEKLYLLQIAELKNDKLFLQNLLSKTN